MPRIKFLIPLLALFLTAAETRNYLVFRRDNFPQDRYLLTISPQEFKTFVDTGKKDISSAGGQPFRMTSYSVNYDGKYALWSVTSDDSDEQWHIDSMEKKGYIVLLSSAEIVAEYTVQRGWQEKFSYTALRELPTDYFQVAVSTP